MASIIRHTAVWSGSPGLPGYTQFYQEVSGTVSVAAQNGHTYIGYFFEQLVSLIPEEITLTVDPVYQVVDAVTGDVTGEETVASAHAPVVGTYVGDWARQVGVLIEWTTGQFLNGRRFRGRTYLVPLGATSMTDGTLPDNTLAVLRAAATSLVTSGWNFLVWHRPVNGAGGSASHITGQVVRDHAAILRSRMR